MATSSNKPDPRLISYQTLRKAVGWLGVLLPFSMLAGNYFLKGCTCIQDTISNYVYTVTGSLFIGILCADALFLIVYKGYDKRDALWTNAAGILALGIAFLPTNDDSADSCAIIHLPYSTTRNMVHYTCAASFFLSLAYISLFLFTKSTGVKTKQKIKRNRVYRVCGVTIIIAIALIALYGLIHQAGSRLSRIKPIFWLETIALLAFGISWLVKGGLVLEDEDNSSDKQGAKG